MKSSEILLVIDLNDDERERVVALIRQIEEDRKIVTIGGERVETAAREPNVEKR